MSITSELQTLETELITKELSFMEKIEVKDRIIQIKQELGIQERPAYEQIQCIGCSG